MFPLPCYKCKGLFHCFCFYHYIPNTCPVLVVELINTLHKRDKAYIAKLGTKTKDAGK